jgi:hypothetical protein
VTRLFSVKATPAAALARLPDHRFAHIVCHGILEPRKHIRVFVQATRRGATSTARLLELQPQATYDVIAYLLNSSMTQLSMYLPHIPFVYHTPGSIWYT